MTDAAPKSTPPRRGGGALIPTLAVLGVIAVGGAFAAQQTPWGKKALAAIAAALPGAATARAEPPVGCILGPLPYGRNVEFELFDKNGNKVSATQIAAGGPSILYFGFTSCPSECPTTMRVWPDTLRLLAEDGVRVQPVFISFDPAVDKTDVIDAFLEQEGFPPDLIALTGANAFEADGGQARTEKAKEAFRVTAVPTPDPGSAAGQTWAHSSHVYIMDEQRNLRGLYTSMFSKDVAVATAEPDGAAACIRAALETE